GVTCDPAVPAPDSDSPTVQNERSPRQRTVPDEAFGFAHTTDAVTVSQWGGRMRLATAARFEPEGNSSADGLSWPSRLLRLPKVGPLVDDGVNAAGGTNRADMFDSG